MIKEKALTHVTLCLNECFFADRVPLASDEKGSSLLVCQQFLPCTHVNLLEL